MKLSKAKSSMDLVYNPYTINGIQSKPFIGDNPYAVGTSPYVGIGPFQLSSTPTNYSEELFQCRFFYNTDPTASTVINRMAELAGGLIKNRRESCTDEEFAYFDGISDTVTHLLKTAALEYLVAGMAIPDYGYTRKMGNRIEESLGRKRYTVPDRMWIRNPENIILKREPFGGKRRVYLRIPREEVSFIQNKGVYPDGTEDKELYAMLVREFPEYVQAIMDGKTQIPLPNARPILRKPSPTTDYPQPFLVPALAALKHKLRIREMDHSIATRAIEAILLVKAGNDEYPVTEDDDTLDTIKAQMKAKSVNMADSMLYRLFTNHTVEMGWIYPPLEALLTPTKYDAVDADIFMAMGFSRVLLVGESNKSNAGAGTQVILGPLAMLKEMREQLLDWVEELYEELAELNNFTHTPEPYFDELVLSDASTLIQQAGAALKAGVISKDTFARMFGTDFETELKQIEYEAQVISSSPAIDQMVQLGQQTHTAPTTVQTQDQNGNVTTDTQLPSDMLNQ